MNTEEFTVNFSHPEIMKARASAYALLLQWRKEREEQSNQSAQATTDTSVNPRTNLRNSEPEVYCPESKEGPTPAGSEQK